MNNQDKVSPKATSSVSEELGTTISWSASTGDGVKSHLVYVNPSGIFGVLNIKDSEVFEQLERLVKLQPEKTVDLICSSPKSYAISNSDLACVKYSETLGQLTIFNKDQKKQKITNGKNSEQKAVFEAIQKHLGGTQSQEDADVWAVVQVPLFALTVFGVIGGLFIHHTTTSSPDYVATGRRRGVGQMLNWIGYTVGPVWASVIVGAVALSILSFMTFLLVKRPTREVLSY